MSTDWAGQSISFFFANWTLPETQQANRGLFNYFPAMYAASPSVCFTDAVSAAALAYMANTSSIDRLNKMAQETYGRALAGMMLAMSDKATATSDETLAAVAALAVYEAISGRKSRREPFTLHRLGLSTIIKLRGPDQFRSSFGRDVFVAINKILLWRDLQDQRRPTLGLNDWPAGLYSNPAMEFSARLAVRVVDLCGRTREAAEVAPADTDVEWLQNLETLIQDALDIDQEVQHHLDNPPKNWHWWSLPVPWRGTAASNTSSSSSESDESDDGQHSAPMYPSHIDIYPSLTIATHWNTVRGNRLPIIRTFRTLSLLTRQHPLIAFPALPSLTDLQTSLNTTIADICASVPFLVGDFDASGALSDTGARIQGGHVLSLIWALHMLCGINGLEPGLKAWMLKVLARMGTAGGVKQGLVLSKLHSEPMVPKPWGLT
ncbi:hypothetical protein MMC32_004700 [Xylographa parallela]|nr:hypothetical protein [Xylographa parallela]